MATTAGSPDSANSDRTKKEHLLVSVKGAWAPSGWREAWKKTAGDIAGKLLAFDV
jgi:hypothetical protein